METTISSKNCRPNNRYTSLSTSKSNKMFNHSRNSTQRSMLNRFFGTNIHTLMLILFVMAGLQTGKCLNRFIYCISLSFFAKTVFHFGFNFVSKKTDVVRLHCIIKYVNPKSDCVNGFSRMASAKLLKRQCIFILCPNEC